MGAGRAAAAAALLGGLLMVALPAVARADFVVTMCGGNPAPPWVEGYNANSGWASVSDSCAAPGGQYGFNLGPSAYLNWSNSYGAGIQIPSGEVLTNAAANFHTQAVSSGSDAFLRWGYAQNIEFTSYMGDSRAGTHVSFPVSDGSDVWFNVFCSTDQSTNCYFGSPFGIVGVGAVSLTLHDTGLPSIASGGGSLAATGVYKGEQTLLYRATDAGSGVARVTAALGSTVVATATSSCQSWNLRPCPPSTAGILDVNTNQVPNGTYPVILTAYDASGDGVPLQVSTVTVRNPVGSVKVTSRARRTVHAQLVLTWRWDPKRTRLTALTYRHVPARATVKVTCAGRGCPIRTERVGARRLPQLRRNLVGRAFHAGDRLTLTISARGLRPERAQVRIRRNALPRVRRL